MLRIRPFVAIRPKPNQAARVASPPYDVIDTEEARALASGNDLSFLHVVRPEIDLPPGTDPYADEVYARAQENLDRMIEQKFLVADDEPMVFLYRQVMNHRPQIGIVCCCHVDDYDRGLIKKHEKTRQAKEDDRTRHVLTLNANTGPVFLTYRDVGEIQTLVDQDTNHRPLYHFDAPDGVTHTVWTVQNPERYVEAFGRVPCAYIADGHHRAASAARAGRERREADPDPRADDEYNWFLTVLFPASALNILAYNRTVRDLGDLDPAAFLDRLRGVGTLTATDEPCPDRPGVLCVYCGGAWHRLEIDPAMVDGRDPIASLDVSILQDRVLEPILGIGDPRTDPRIDFVGGIRGTKDLEQRVDGGKAAAAFSMFPTTIEQLLAVADAERIMPPKSTWFEPKLRSGLFVHRLDEVVADPSPA